MVGIPSRHRSLFLLTGVVLLQVLLLAVQIKRDSQGRLIQAGRSRYRRTIPAEPVDRVLVQSRQIRLGVPQ